jgi:hypothetical protein
VSSNFSPCAVAVRTPASRAAHLYPADSGSEALKFGDGEIGAMVLQRTSILATEAPLSTACVAQRSRVAPSVEMKRGSP